MLFLNSKEHKKCLIFIFNADSGAINSIKDFFHKMIKPSTYECNLCAVTFGNFGMKKEWVQYLSEIDKDVNIEFYHRDEFEEYFPEVKDATFKTMKFGEVAILLTEIDGVECSVLVGGEVVIKKVKEAQEKNLLPLLGTIVHDEVYYDIV